MLRVRSWQAVLCAQVAVFANSFLLAVPPEVVPIPGSGPTRGSADVAVPIGSSSSIAPHAEVAAGADAHDKIQLISQIMPQEFDTNASCQATSSNVCANDCWGYVSPSGREYAILGLRQGTGFVDITDPRNPEIVANINDANSLWSDVTVYGDYAFNGNEAGGGLQIFDLTNIDPPNRQVTMTTFTASGLQTIHTMTVNAASQTLYLSGSNLSGGRLIALNISNPMSPTIAGLSQDSVYVHQAEVITYTSGPYAGREIAFCYAGGNGLRVLDVTNKANMFRISTFSYGNMSYCHQGSITPDRQYVLLNDETDGLPLTRIVNVTNLSALTLAGTFQSSTTIDHDLFIVGDYIFESNYTSGLHVFHFNGPNDVVRTGYYDTYAFNNGSSYNGTWANYPFFPSGNVIVSDMQGGLFILDPSEALDELCEETAGPAAGTFPEPKQRYLSISPGSPGVISALRVQLASLPPAFAAREGEYRYVDTPVQLPDPKGQGGTYYRSRLTCTPRYLNWGSYGSIEIADDAIVPGATYEIQAIGEMCHSFIASNYSSAIVLGTAPLWGDVVGTDGNIPPDGIRNVVDVAAIVDSVKAVPSSIDVTQADVDPNDPDFQLNAVDISRVVDALKGAAYPFPGPSACP
jgi:choice-of-anchor B domain-containing protein